MAEQQQQRSADEGDPPAADRLTGLPQAIWVHILSLLPSRDAVATGLLSRRWRRRWHHLPHLGLDPDAFYVTAGGPPPSPCGYGSCRTSDFAAFLDLVLPACAVRRTLRRLALCPACYCHSTSGGIDRWVRLAMAARRLEAAELKFSRFSWEYDLGGSIPYGLGPIAVPDTLQELKLVSCGFSPPGFATFAGLKTLVLASVTLHVGDPISQCPLLERLTMRDCKFQGSLEIRHARLRRLEVEHCSFSSWSGAPMEVDTPELETLSVAGLLCCEALVVRNALLLRSLAVDNCFTRKEEGLGASLQVEAPALSAFRFVGSVGRECSLGGGGGGAGQLGDVEMEVYPPCGDQTGTAHSTSSWIGELLKWVSSARTLTLSGGSLQCLSVEVDAPEMSLPNKFNNLKALRLDVGLVPQELPGLACLLRSSPFLHTLSISLGGDQHTNNASPDHPVNLGYELQNLDQLYGDYWETQESPINCLVHHLKRVEIKNYCGRQIEEELACFLANNAMVLKQMPISTPSTTFSGFDFL